MRLTLFDKFNGTEQKIDKTGATVSIDRPVPPYVGIEGSQPMRPFRQFLTDDGTSTGDQDMTVDGSSTPVDFFVPAPQEDDLYICIMSFVLTEPSMGLNEWANTGSPLSNGVRIFYEDEKGEEDIHNAGLTNWDLIRLCLGDPAFGSGATTFRASNVVGTDEGYVPFLDLRKTFGFQWGVLLRGGTKQKLVIRIQDNITSTDGFDCIAYGFTRSKD